MANHPLPSSATPGRAADVVIVGAGLAGTTAAAVIGRQGWRVCLVDPRRTCPPVFKAEKIEPDQAASLRKLGLLECLLPYAGRVREIRAYYNGRLFGLCPTEQYGIAYGDMVNALRASLPGTVQFVEGRAVEIVNGGVMQTLKLADRRELSCRFVILACGLNRDLPASLQLTRRWIQRHQSVAVALNLARVDGVPFPFDSVTYYPTRPAERVDYVSIFPVGNTMRANLFAFPPGDADWLRQFITEPQANLDRCFPKLRRAIGEYRVVGKVETSQIDLYRTDGNLPPGIVLIGDAGQNVCPSTGMGLTKIFTDVEILCMECLPAWLATPGAAQTASFHDHPRKRATDTRALKNAWYRRQASTGRSLKWKIHRARLHLSRQFSRPVSRRSAVPASQAET